MRGVCALNLEAMSMFQHGDAEGKLNVLDQLCFHRIHTVVSSQFEALLPEISHDNLIHQLSYHLYQSDTLS